MRALVSQWNPGLGVLKFISEYKVYDDGYLMATAAGIYYGFTGQFQSGAGVGELKVYRFRAGLRLKSST